MAGRSKKREMQYDTITLDDLSQIGNLQPDGWPDITVWFRFFISNEFCKPIKIVIEDQIVGVGCSIVFKDSAWLGHIIVGSEYRNRGLGFHMVERMLCDLKNKSINTVSLIASPLGESVYKKAGFRFVSDYIFLTRKTPWIGKEISSNIKSCKGSFYKGILRLDREISGEGRERLLGEHLTNAFVYIDGNEITGFYIPTLGDGPIFADTTEAGTALMSLKYANVDKAVLPGENQTGLDFLLQNGFEITEKKGTRMILGKELDWQPDKFFSRIGGDFG